MSIRGRYRGVGLRGSRKRPGATARLLATTALIGLGAGLAQPAPARAQAAVAEAVRDYRIPAQPLSAALNAFGRQSGLQVTLAASAIRGIVSRPVSGRLTPQQALGAMLAGTGVEYQLTADGTVVVEQPVAPGQAVDADGSLVLDTIDVTGRSERQTVGWDGAPETIYETPGEVSYISRETVERYRGTSPADVLKSTAGVFSGSSRNSGGLDVNIRGLQGQGRTPVTVDGTLNSTSVYRGYQGVGNRSYIDPDFIGGIAIRQGPDTGPGGAGAIGGTVSIRTVSADDIVPEGKTFGMRLKRSVGTNTTPVGSMPKQTLLQPTYGIFEEIERPGVLEPTSGATSVILAAKSENLDLLAGYARRRTGNYHAGTTGEGAPAENTGYTCPYAPSYCDQVVGWYDLGLTPFLGGEEVLNTSQDTVSALVKGTLRLGDDHTLELAYSKYYSAYGENYPSSIFENTQTVQQGDLSEADLDRYSSQYRWNPANELVDFKWNIWRTDLLEHSVQTGGTESVAQFVETWGTDFSNTSRFETAFGSVIAEYGGGYLSEATGPDEEWTGVPGREGTRRETNLFARTSWAPTDWLTLDAGVRYQDFEVNGESFIFGPNENEDQALGYSGGITLTPFDGLQLFGSYKEASRLPSLMEGTRGFLLMPDPDLGPETAHNWEFGANFSRSGVFDDADAAGLKLTYFHNSVDNYISRTWNPPEYPYQMFVHNIDKAKFEGFNAQARYERDSFSAELSASYFTNLEYCRTADTCQNSSLSADYATNQVPPKFSASLSLSKSFLEDRLTLGGRVTRVGARAGGAEATSSGAYPFVAPIPWEPYTLVDLFGSYRLNDYATVDMRIENLTDVYYVEPANLGLIPAPGRTVWVSLTSQYSGGGDGADGAGGGSGGSLAATHDWTGFHVGAFTALANGISEAKDVEMTSGSTVSLRNYDLGTFDTGLAGLRAGYNRQFANDLVLGVEADVNLFNAELRSPLTVSQPNYIVTDMDWTASVRAKAGMAVGRLFAYGTGGLAAGAVNHSWNLSGDEFSDSAIAHGWIAGGGVEYALTDRVSINGEFLSSWLKSDFAGGTSADTRHYTGTQNVKIDQIRLGLNVNF